MSVKELKGVLSFEMRSSQNKKKIWSRRNLPVRIDFSEECITFKAKLSPLQKWYYWYNFYKGEFELCIKLFVIQYRGKKYKVDLAGDDVIILGDEASNDIFSLKISEDIIKFKLKSSRLSLHPYAEDCVNKLVFLGARFGKFEAVVNYNTQKLHIFSEKGSDILTVESQENISEKIKELVILAFALFQNAEISLLEQHSADKFYLGVQLPPSPGVVFKNRNDFFDYIWNFLISGDNLSKAKNSIEFFLAGARSRGALLDFRLINLFIALEAICHDEKEKQEKNKQFGDIIAEQLSVSSGDGYLLAYIRNAMVHEGAEIGDAIEQAYDIFNRKQRSADKKLDRYIDLIHNDHREVKLYFDLAYLIMDYFRRVVEYPYPIENLYESIEKKCPVPSC